MEYDLRDLQGRTRRMVLSILVGIVISIALAYSFPTTPAWPHWQSCFGHPGKVMIYDLPLIGSGVVASAFGTNALLGAWSRRRRVPAMRVVSR